MSWGFIGFISSSSNGGYWAVLVVFVFFVEKKVHASCELHQKESFTQPTSEKNLLLIVSIRDLPPPPPPKVGNSRLFFALGLLHN